jgi:hypothetical protein
MHGAACTVVLRIDGQKAFALGSGEYQALYLVPGRHSFGVEFETGRMCPASYTGRWDAVIADGADESYRVFLAGRADEPSIEVVRATPGDASGNAAGQHWTRRATPGDELSGVAWSGRQFVAVGQGMLVSPDGLTWSVRDVPKSWRLYGIVWTGSQFVTFGQNITRRAWVPLLATSPDGETWTERNVPVTLSDIVWTGSQLVGVGGNTILASADGLSWDRRNIAASARFRGISWGGSQFVAVGTGFTNSHEHSSALIATSPDGASWRARDAPGTRLEDVAWSGHEWVAVGYEILTSTDGVTWIERKPPVESYGLNAISWDGTQFVTVGSVAGLDPRGLVLTSPDGVNWTQRPQQPKRGQLRAVAWSGARYVAVGAQRKGWFADYMSVLVMTSP